MTAPVVRPADPQLEHPNGWFAACFSDELPPAGLLARTMFGRELVVYRTESGQVAVVDAHCPHMGAHFGHGGAVEGERLRCPFHGFRFASDGQCTDTPYGTKIPPKCRTNPWPTIERDGVVLVWHHHAGAPPSFEIPEYDLRDWVALETRCFTVATHPQETSENSVDVGHFSEVHGYHSVALIEPLRVDGPYLTLTYSMARSLLGEPLETRFRVHVHGLGFSHVEASVPALGLELRYWVMCTPTGDGTAQLRLAGSARMHPGLARIHRGLARVVARLANKFGFHALCHDASQDFEIWEHKRYIDPPALARGDGPVGPYRKWCRQFYPQANLVEIRKAG
jgi:nitrite reductase/ring-hydroxylating ferredoxin subunit